MGSCAAREVCTETTEAGAGLGAGLGEIPAASAGMTEVGAGVAELEGRGSVNRL